MSEAARTSGIRLIPVDFDPFADEAPTALPLIEAQKEIWTAIRMGESDASCAYNLCYAMRLRGPLDVDAVRRAFQALVGRHEALRLGFDAHTPEQRVVPAPAVEAQVLNFTGLSGADQDARVAALLAEESRTAFDLSSPPLLRVRIARLAPENHVVALTMHHIACDGWSASALFTELGALYQAEAGGRPAELPTAQPFTDYVRWQQTPEWRAIHASSEAYWLEQLREPPALDLPTDRPRPRLRTHWGGQARLDIDPGLARQLRRVAGKYGCTPYIMLLAGYQTLLHRLTGQDDVVVGTAVAGQSMERWSRVVGHCVSVLPVRSRVDVGAPFSRHLAATKRAVLDAQAHQTVTFGTLVPKLPLGRDAGRIPLVSAVFNLDRVFGKPRFGDLEVEFLRPPKSFVTFELSLNVIDDGSGMVLEADYNTDLFDDATIRRWLGHLRTLLDGIASDPERPIGTLPLLTPAERHQIVAEWNETGVDYPCGRGVHELVSAQAAMTPAAPAVICGDQALSYGELDQRADCLAQHLRRRGVGPGVVVGIYVEPSVEMVVGLLGILKAGGAYLPLDPAYPAERLAFILTDAGAPLVVTQARLASQLPVVSTPVVRLDTDWDEIAAERREGAAAAVYSHDLAYVIYTSGSTGRPKGVLIEHGGLTNLVFAKQQLFGTTAGDRTTQVAAFGFDATVFEIWPTLAVGATLYVADEDTRHSPELMLAWLKERAVTQAFLPTPLAEALLDADWSGASLSLLTTAGDVLRRRPPPDLPFRLFNLYGPTEATVWTTSAEVEPDPSGSLPSIGRPIPNMRAYVLDERMQAVPVGVAGELVIGGVGVGRGYLRRPELTAERFVASPFVEGDRLYRTGDRARYIGGGTLEFLGRMDTQVKIRGFRIEPGEIEAVLAQHPAVRQCLVLAREDRPGQRRLVAYVVMDEDRDGNASLREYLKARLPDYMIPSAFVPLGALPLTPNGKVDRQALPAVEGLEAERSYVAPKTETQSRLAGLWAEVLGLQRVGITDDFFDLGGHSLLAAEVTGRARESFGITLPVRVIFEAPTVMALGEHIDILRWALDGRARSPKPDGLEEITL
jgi:amino acid adenylation domain-containing protein